MSVKKSKWFWASKVGPWKCWGLWWKQTTFIGVTIIQDNEDWYAD